MVQLRNIALFSLVFVLVQGGLQVYAQDKRPAHVPVGPCDPIRATAGDKKTEAQVAPPETDTKHIPITLEEAGQRFGEIQNVYFAENATREQKRQAQDDLHDLSDQVNAEHARLEDKGNDNVAINAMARLKDSIRNALKEIDGEIGPPKSIPSQPAVKKDPGPTIPSYYVNEAAAEAATELRTAQELFRNHLQNEPASSEQPMKHARWQSQRNELLVDMVMAEEQFAWDAAGGYTKEERNTLADPYAAMRNLRNSMADIAKQNQEIDRLLGDMATFEEQHNQMMQGITEGPHWSGFGRAGYLGIALVRAAHGLIVDRINAMNLELGAEQERLLGALQSVNETLNNAYRSRRERGIRNIRRKACQQALSRGQGDPEPFYVHRPQWRDVKDTLTRRLREHLTERLGKSAPQPLMGDVETLLGSDKNFTREFNTSVQKRMRTEGN
jgi:hypothetical protein